MGSTSLAFRAHSQIQIVRPETIGTAKLIVENVSNEDIERLLSEVRFLGGSHFLKKYISRDSKYSLDDLLYVFGYKIVTPPLTRGVWSVMLIVAGGSRGSD